MIPSYETNFIDIYYDNILSKIYIITGNDGFIKSYDYAKNIIYHKYYDNDNNNNNHISIIINEQKLIDSSFDGNIRIWNFHSGELLNKIKIGNVNLFSICLWNNEYLIIGTEDNKIKILNLKTGIILKSLIDCNNSVLCIKKFFHPKYGECLISEGLCNEQIKIWVNKYLIK